ncbi:MAG TPA: glycosyltransferase family 25 protein [Chitinophagaceae bacterium]|nr:glycosyltransferase family 25 protein [Chitinophagaceae bacterium]
MQSFLFQLLNSYFNKIFVLTIARATERHAFIKEHLEGLDFEFFWGIDKKDLTIDTLIKDNIYNSEKARQIHRYDREMTAGQIACSWGHAKIYEEIVKNGYKSVLILEDDVTANFDALQDFPQIMSELPQDWELVYFDYHKREASTLNTKMQELFYHLRHISGSLKWNHTMINHLHAKDYSTHLNKAGFHEFTSAYALTQNAAAKLLALQKPIAFVADNLLAYAVTNKIIKAFITVPRLFEQQSQQIGGRSISYVDE